jgi:hypothetical protein
MIFMFTIILKQKHLSCHPERAIRIHAMLNNLGKARFPLSVLLVLLVVEKGFVRGGTQNNRNLNVARELEVVARCAARFRESTQ